MNIKTLANRAGPLVAGTVSVATAVVQAVTGNWDAATWALLAGAAWFLHALHRCPAGAEAPPSAPVTEPTADPADARIERGETVISFYGGPFDGDQKVFASGALAEVFGEKIAAEGWTYTVTSVDHTCYTAAVDR